MGSLTRSVPAGWCPGLSIAADLRFRKSSSCSPPSDLSLWPKEIAGELFRKPCVSFFASCMCWSVSLLREKSFTGPVMAGRAVCQLLGGGHAEARTRSAAGGGRFLWPQMGFCQDAVKVMTGWHVLLFGKAAHGADGPADYQGFPFKQG